MSARHRTQVRHGDVALDVIVEGAGPAILLLPSLGRDSEDYDPVAAGLAARGYRVLRPQPRGLGASRGPMHGLTLADYADDVAATLRSLDAAPAVLVGHAFGNWVARMTAARHPQLVRGVAIAAAAARRYPPQLTEAIRRIADPATPRAQRLADLQATFFAPGNDARVWLDGWHRDVRDSQFAAHLATPQDAWWGAGRAPLLDLQAADDPFLPPERRHELRAELGPRVSAVLIERASHALLPEQPQAVVAAVADWADRLPPGAPAPEGASDA
ncbi:alpha/beta hydrolase [Luteimonas sp. Y-2-2-4F]|nr:alpha/beta hydrolase [Luteimonas sp. Y-2-2-4F]MCD9033807.1 alpha/beta hydrolase [Luteimonas sp. Y-2-2-4F]